MPRVEIEVRNLLVNTTFEGDIPQDVLDAAKNLGSGRLSEAEYLQSLSVGEKWSFEEPNELLERAAVFDKLRGIIPGEKTLNINTPRPEGNRTENISVTDRGTGFPEQIKWPRDL